MSYQHILVERADGYAVITINRPRVLNALNSATIHEIEQAVDDLIAGGSVRAVIITGAGEKAFVAGADIAELNALPNATEGTRLSEADQRLLFKLADAPVVFIAAINGFALGGGFELALGCDLRLAADSAQLGLPEVTLGLIPGWGGTQRAARLAGAGIAKYLVLTGERIKADEALQLGLVEKVYPASELMERARELAAKIAALPPLAIAAGKQVINRGLDMPLREACAYESALFGQLTASEDCKEGTAAFLEKRKPTWKGK